MKARSAAAEALARDLEGLAGGLEAALLDRANATLVSATAVRAELVGYAEPDTGATNAAVSHPSSHPPDLPPKASPAVAAVGAATPSDLSQILNVRQRRGV